MRSLFVGVLLTALCGVAQSQVTCQTYGNTTNCNGSLGPSISPLPFMNYADMQARANLQNQQAALAQQQAQLARVQAEAIRQQTIAANQQRFLAAVATASDEDLRAAAAHWNSVKCGWLAPASCHDDASFAVQAIDAEMRRRQERQEQQSDWYYSYRRCLSRFATAQSSDEASMISYQCKRDPSTFPPRSR